MNALETVFSWVLTTTWQASVLAVLILAAQGLLGARLNPRWRHALWLLVVLRLVLPTLPESALSLFRYAPATPLNLPETFPTTEVSAPVTANVLPVAPELVIPQPNHTFLILALLWLSGALGLLLLTFLVNHRFARHVAHAPPITDESLRKIFADAKAELGIRRHIRLVESSHVSSPAIMGLFTPTLLLPDNAPGKFSPRELRFIFLHELAHLKRGDVFIQALVALLQVIHWFNPVLWYAFRRLRADREPATDALVLSRTGEADKEPYGLMLLKLLEHFNQRHALPTLVGILEDKDQFKRRFSLIAKFTRGAYGWSLLGLIVLIVLGVACLTKAKAQTALTSTATSAGPMTVPAPAASAPDAMTDLRAKLLAAREDADARRVLLDKLRPLSDDQFVATMQGLGRAGLPITDLSGKIADENAQITNLLNAGLDPGNPRISSIHAEVEARQEQLKRLINGERQALAIDLEIAESRVNVLQESSGSAAAPDLAEVKLQLTSQQQDLAVRRARIDKLRSLPNDQFVAAIKGLGRNTPEIDALDQKITDEYADVAHLLASGFNANHPLIVSKRAEIATREQERTRLIDGVRSAMDFDLSMAESRVKLLQKQAGGAAKKGMPASDPAPASPAPASAPTAPSTGAGAFPVKPPAPSVPTPTLTPADYHPAGPDPSATAPAKFIHTEVKILEIGEADYQAHRAEIDAAVQRGDSQPLAMLPSYHELDKMAVLTKSGEQGVMEAVSVLPYAIALGKNTTGQPTPVEYARRNLGVRVMILPEVKNGRIQLTAFPEVMSLTGWVGLDTALPEPAFNIRADHLSDSFLDGESKGFPFPGGAQDVPLDPAYGYNAGTKPDPVKSRTMKGRLFYFIIVRECDRDGPASAKANSAVPANGVPSLQVLHPSPSGIRANIDVVREFPYPTSFEPAKLAGGGTANVTPMMPLTPREFAIKNVGVSAEITPNINPADSHDPGKIVLGGSVSVVDFNGFTTSNVAGAHLPSFITSESNFIEQMDDDKAKGVWLPSLQEDPEPNLKEGTAPESPTAALPTKHLLLFVSAARVP